MSGDWTRWRRELVNDFSAPVLDAYPEIASAHDMLVEMGASYVSLSGSGSAVFGVFDDSGAISATSASASLS